MEELVAQLASTAREERIVARQAFVNGMQLLAYPLDNGVLFALGMERDASPLAQMAGMLRKRSENPQRFGSWLPAMLNDGSCYVVRRVEEGVDEIGLSLEDLQAAEELLA